MHLVLVAASDFEILREIIKLLPQDSFKPLATRSTEGLISKLQGRDVPLAIVHESFVGPRTVEYCAYLRQELPKIQTIYLRDLSLEHSVHPNEVPFEPPGRTLAFPCEGPILARAMNSLVGPKFRPPNMGEQMAMIEELRILCERAAQQNHYERLHCPIDAPHFALADSFDNITNEYHPDRYRWIRNLEPLGKEVYQQVNNYYKLVVESWNILKNRTSRKEYDHELEQDRFKFR